MSQTRWKDVRWIILLTKKSPKIVPIDCSASVLLSAHACATSGTSPSAVWLSDVVAMEGGNCFEIDVIESSKGKITFHTHSSHVSRLRVAPYSCSVLNRVWIAPTRTSDRESVHNPSTSSNKNIQRALYSASSCESLLFACMESETPHRRVPAAVKEILVSAC